MGNDCCYRKLRTSFVSVDEQERDICPVRGNVAGGVSIDTTCYSDEDEEDFETGIFKTPSGADLYRRFSATTSFRGSKSLDIIMHEFWPALRGFIEEQILIGMVQPVLQRKVSSYAFFDRCSLGSGWPRLIGSKTYARVEESRGGEKLGRTVELALRTRFDGDDVDISVTVAPGIRGTIKKFFIEGVWCIELARLIPQAPLISGVTLYFMNAPYVSVQFGGVLKHVEGRFVEVKQIIEQQISNQVVVPNRIALHVSPKLTYYELKYPDPAGIVEFFLKGVTNVRDRTDSLVPLTVSAKLQLGSESVLLNSKEVDGEGFAEWEQTPASSFIVDVLRGQKIIVEIYRDNNCDLLGRGGIAAAHIASASISEIILETEQDRCVQESAGQPHHLLFDGSYRPFFVGQTLMEAQHIVPLDDGVRGVISVVIDSIYDLGQELNGESVEVIVRAGTEKKSSWQVQAERMTCKSAGDDVEERLRYFLFPDENSVDDAGRSSSRENNAFEESRGHDCATMRSPRLPVQTVAWALGLEPTVVAAIARRSIQAQFRQALRFRVRDPFSETLSLEVTRSKQPDQPLYSYTAELRDLLYLPDWTSPLTEKPLNALRASSGQSSPSIRFSFKFLALGNPEQAENSLILCRRLRSVGSCDFPAP
eukprot:TRINITY_DN25573_c0_g1_i1.p1 TRINITY_DN25573_c0_g1~~TRINITY_DN25573_c0_g1_i1.p1  ORF type:complete len:649 (+),score=74.06 TRINITY_DN25573_c0_g1_i1:26-1972(+)